MTGPSAGQPAGRGRVSGVPDASLYDFAGGTPAFVRLAAAHHQRCLDDAELNHPFSHVGHNSDHIAHLAAYWAEVMGGPPEFSLRSGGQSAMLELHARMGADDDLGRRFVDCFVTAANDAELPADPDFRRALRNYMEWAVGAVMIYNPPDAIVAPALPMPRWSWDGLQP